MRNLKRVLSLALASAMLLGMMVMGAGAADTKKPLTDLDKVVNKDAVNLMVDLAVITGKPDGSYAPTETVDRATMATLIYKIMTGETNADAFKGASSLADVKGTWAEGFINYCSSMKIVNGDGTYFYPTNKVTVAQAAKMLLVAIGYDADLSKYQGDSMWSVNIMRDAKKAGILDGIGQNATEELTRDNAAQMISNTLFADIVKPVIDRDQGVAYLTKYDPIGSTLASDTYKLVKVTGTVTGVADGKASFTTVTPDSGSKIKNAINKAEIVAGTDMMGKNATVYVKGSVSYESNGAVKSVTVDKVYSTVLSSGASSVLGTSMDGTSIADLTVKSNDSKKFIAAIETLNADENTIAASYYINGESKTAAQVATAVNGNAGVIVEFIDTNSNGLIDLVKVTAKAVDFVDGDVETRTYKNELQVLVPVTGATWKNATDVKGYEDLADGDAVLYYTANGISYYVLADTVTGKVTGSKSTGEIRVDGTYYGWSGIDGAATDADVKTSDGKLNTTDEFLFGLDDNGSIAYVKPVTENATAATGYIIDAAYVTGGGVGKNSYVEVQVLLSDGTTEVGTVKAAKNASDATITLDNDAPAAIKGNFCGYTVDKNGKYTLTLKTDAAFAAGDKVTNGKAVITKADGTARATANSKTIYFVAKGAADEKTYLAYTGYAAVPSMAVASGKYVVDGNVIKYAFIDTTAFTGDSETANYIYLIDPDSYTTENDGDTVYYVYDVIMDGAKTTLSMDAQLVKATAPAGLYKGITVTDDVATAADFKSTNKVSGVTYDKTTHSIGNGIVVLDKTYTYDKDTKVFMIIVDEEGAADITTTSCDRVKLTNTDVYDYAISAATVKTDGELLSALYIVQTTK